MPQGSVNLRLRPVKLAFLVDPSETKAILEIIKACTFYWGGVYNPIIPAVKRLPKLWEAKSFRSAKAKHILSGYLDAYDPDFVVPVGKVASQTFDVGNRQTLKFSELFEGVEENGCPRYGIGLFEILRHFIARELKFIRRKPLDVCLPNIGRAHQLALAAIFGGLPDNLQHIFEKYYADEIGAKTNPCSLENYAEFLLPQRLFLRRFSSLYVKPILNNGGSRDQCIFVFDAKSNLDIIDYWNIRAMGWNVIPVIKQVAHNEAVKKLTVDFIDENYVPYRHNPDMFYYTTILKGRSITESDLKQFVNSLQIEKPKKEGETKYVMQFWYPRIWDEWARDKDGVAGCDLDADAARHEINASEEDFSIPTLDPKFINEFGGHGEPRFVNEVDVRFYGDKEINAEVIPEADDTLTRAIGRYSFREWRFSKRGMIYFSQHTKWRIGLQVPRASEVFLAWLKYQKLDAEISDSALIAKQMVKCLGGTWGISTLANEGIIKLLEDMRFQKSLKKKTLFDQLNKISQSRKFPRDPQAVVKHFVESKMIRLGANVQCLVCRRHAWHSIADLDYDLLCPNCTAQFPIPSHQPDEIEWSYRTFGPFSLQSQGQGVYSVLLTLRFFSQILHASTTTIPGFKVKISGKDKEFDLGLFFRESMFGNSKTELIFIECKTYRRFDEKDAERMMLLAKHFPGSIIGFATLNRALNQKEKRILTKVANRGRRYMKAERPYNPVLVLTGNELFSDLSLSHTWKELGGLHKTFSDRVGLRNILELCDATQQIYLGLKSWREAWREKWERRRQRKTALPSSLPVQT